MDSKQTNEILQDPPVAWSSNIHDLATATDKIVE